MKALKAHGIKSLLLASLLIGTLGWVGSGSLAADGKERHPHIRAAIRELRESKKDLLRADHDFGGHRVDAIKAVDVAIIQLETALKYDRR
jgi:hypothetical protein